MASKKRKDKDVESFPIPVEDEKPTNDDTKVKLVPKSTTSPQKVISLEDRKFPLQGFVRGKGPLGQAFSVEMKIKDQGKIVKRTRKEWMSLYETFLKAPRG